MTYCFIDLFPRAYSTCTQVAQKSRGCCTQRMEYCGVRCNSRLPPPARDGEDAFLQAHVHARDEAAAVENGQDIVAPFALFERFVDFPDIIELEDVPERLAVPQQAVERPQEDHARLRRWAIQQVEGFCRYVVGGFQLAYEHWCQQASLDELGQGEFALGGLPAGAPDGDIGCLAQNARRLEAPHEYPAIVCLFIHERFDCKMLRGDDSLWPVVVVASGLAVMGDEQTAGPQRAQQAFDARRAGPTSICYRRAVLKFKRGERPSLVDGREDESDPLGIVV